MTAADQTCLFCKIVAGELPADRVYEDERGPGVQGHSSAGAVPLPRHSEDARRDAERFRRRAKRARRQLAADRQAHRSRAWAAGLSCGDERQSRGRASRVPCASACARRPPARRARSVDCAVIAREPGVRVSRKDNLIWIDLEMTGLTPTGPHHRDRHGRHGQRADRARRRARAWRSISPTRCWRAMDEWNTRQHANFGPHRARAREPGIGAAKPSRRRSSSCGSTSTKALADLRQQHLPGSPLPDPAHAGARGVLSLPQSRRLDAEDPRQALVAGGRQSVREEIGASRARRHPRFDSRAAVLPRAPVQALTRRPRTGVVGKSSASAVSNAPADGLVSGRACQFARVRCGLRWSGFVFLAFELTGSGADALRDRPHDRRAAARTEHRVPDPAQSRGRRARRGARAERGAGLFARARRGSRHRRLDPDALPDCGADRARAACRGRAESRGGARARHGARGADRGARRAIWRRRERSSSRAQADSRRRRARSWPTSARRRRTSSRFATRTRACSSASSSATKKSSS